MPKSKHYYTERTRNGTEDQIDIMSPEGKAIASIQFWDEPDTDAAAHAEADAKLIVDALNAFSARTPTGRTRRKPKRSRPVLKGLSR
jgi:hypothetical protein